MVVVARGIRDSQGVLLGILAASVDPLGLHEAIGVERLRARLVTAMTSLETQRAIELPQTLRQKFEDYLRRTGPAQG